MNQEEVTVIECNGERLELPAEQSLFDSFGWLLRPIIQEVGSYEGALQKLNWTVYTCRPL